MKTPTSGSSDIQFNKSKNRKLSSLRLKSLPEKDIPHFNPIEICRMAPEREASIRESIRRARAQAKDPEYLERTDIELGMLNVEKILKRLPWNAAAMKNRAALIKKSFPKERLAVVEICNNVLAHRFDLLGSGLISLGDKINWHKDYPGSYEWPSDIDFSKLDRAAFDILVDLESGMELKFAWDLSNMHWFPSLASSFYLNDDSSCLEAFVADWTNWMHANPPFNGVNWFCPMNIAIRQINVMAAFAAFHPYLSDKLVGETVKSLFRHGLFTMAYLELESGAKRNNHYLTNLCGLYFAGTFFHDTKSGRNWLEFATNELEAECDYQFYADGVSFEDSTSYHRLSLEMLLLCAILARENNRSFSKAFYERLHRALKFTRDITQIDNNIPQFGDNDNGRILQFYGYSTIPVTDHRHILALGGEFFDDDILRADLGEAGVDAIWSLGEFKAINSSAARTRHVEYADSGYSIFNTDQLDLVIRNGRISPYCGGGHAHSDQLSFTLGWKGADIFVDPGAYRYVSDFQARHAFRSVEYHNTIQIGDFPMHECDENTFEGLWWMRDKALAETVSTEFCGDIFRFLGRIHSYQSAGFIVNRKIEYTIKTNCLVVCDSAESSNANSQTSATSRLLLAPEISADAVSSNKISLSKNGVVLAEICILSPQATSSVRQLWFSPSYGKRVPASQIEFHWTATSGFTMAVFMKGDKK